MKVASILAEQPAKAPRRYLAPNVIALWPDDRPPVVNGRWPGRKRGVAPIWRAWLDRFRPGVYAYLWSLKPESVNRGLVVRLLKQHDDGDWEVEAMFGEIRLSDGRFDKLATARPGELRRCAAPKV